MKKIFKKFWDLSASSLGAYIYYLYMGSHMIVLIASLGLIGMTVLNPGLGYSAIRSFLLVFLIYGPLAFYSYKKIKNH